MRIQWLAVLRALFLALALAFGSAGVGLAQEPGTATTPAEDAGTPAVTPAPAGTTEAEVPVVALGNNEIFQKSLAALTMLFVLAVLLENAFALLFNWRVFQAYFSARGVRTIIMVAVSLLLVFQLPIDIVAGLIAAYTTNDGVPDSGPLTKVVTALILAGGSSGVHNLMYALGYRSERAQLEEARPPRDRAWLAVRATRRRAEREILVRIREVGPPSAGAPAPIAGMIASRGPSLLGLILRDRSRFPQSGGYTLLPNVLYEITVEGRDATGDRIAPLDARPIVLAPGAILDLEVTL
jgi:hypothetical protein